MNDTLDWLCGELGIVRDALTSSKRESYIVTRRRIVINFFKHFYKTDVWIGNILNKHWTSIATAYYQTKFEEKKRADELVEKYNNLIEGRYIKELMIEQANKKLVFDKKQVADAICEKYEIKMDDIYSNRHTKSVVDAKRVLYYVFRKAGMSLYEIGRYVKKNHESVLNTLKKVLPEQKIYGDLLFDVYCSESREDRTKKICNLLNEGKTKEEIYNLTGFSKEFIEERIKKIRVKKVPNYQTSEITIKYFLK